MTQPPPKPKRVHKPAEEREAEILAAATHIFAQRGYQLADMQAVADAAGVGKGTVYRYFACKEVLFADVIKYNMDQLSAHVEQARCAQQDPLAQLREGMRAYLTYFEQKPELVELLVQERIEFRNKCESSYFMYALAKTPEWVKLFRQFAEIYPVRDIPMEDMMEIYGDLVHGAVVLDNSPIPRKPLSQRFDVLFDVYLHGILASK